MEQERLLTADEVGAIVGCSGRYVREVLVRQRGLRAIIICRNESRNRMSFRRSDVNDWIAQQARRGI